MYSRHLMLFYIVNENKNNEQTAKTLCAVYGDGVVAESTVRKQLARFRSGKFDLEDWKRFDSRAVVTDDPNETLIIFSKDARYEAYYTYLISVL